MEPDALPSSMIARLLEEISWEKAVKYRMGGRGMENVLTAEVLGGLDLLPRDHFFGEVIRASSGAAGARSRLALQAESAEMSLLSGDLHVNPAQAISTRFVVQPDALITTPDVFALVEAKRIRTSAFQQEQLARELLAVITNSNGRSPLLFLFGVEPPVRVKGLGHLTVADAIERHLPAVLERAGDVGLTVDDLMSRLDDIVCWISWDCIESTLRSQLEQFTAADSSVDASIRRMGTQVLTAIDWHS
ncbi:hypothetical protein I6N91_00345 [Arthrobacter sp. MSA 4-2]|uniref:hypothetical protein n=1 Tax=Arthrobacter sp. MSA 4-2 TaxID=2794349 RepID=UPI0018E8F65C|nr:hypothetical protein [Arthrobacter sp. MSA 4-2]MBJ2119424.1 hypothetical protein [Arthrobacter sp. MSA 4-2]